MGQLLTAVVIGSGTGNMPLRVISSQSSDEVNQRRAEAELVVPLRSMAANVLRIVRGAGKPELLAANMVACLQAFERFREAHGAYPPPDRLRRILDPDEAQLEYRPWTNDVSSDDEKRWEADGTRALQRANRDIRRASLQIAASMLLDQMSINISAEYDLNDGVRDHVAARQTGSEKRGKSR